MLDIEVIKWGCGIAEGFEYRGLTEVYFFAHNYRMNGGTFKNVVYPLFLQRVIEGVNLKSGMFMIRQNRGGIEIFNEVTDYIQDFYFLGTHDTDQAKEQAITYIYKKLNKID